MVAVFEELNGTEVSINLNHIVRHKQGEDYTAIFTVDGWTAHVIGHQSAAINALYMMSEDGEQPEPVSRGKGGSVPPRQ